MSQGAAGRTVGDSSATFALQSPHSTSKESSDLDHPLHIEFADGRKTDDNGGGLEAATTPGESLPWSRTEQRSCPQLGGDHPLLPITLWQHIPELRRDPQRRGNVREPRQQPAWLRTAEHGAATWKSSLRVSKLPLCCESSSMREPDGWDQPGTAPPGCCLAAPAGGCGGAHGARLRSRWRILEHREGSSEGHSPSSTSFVPVLTGGSGGSPPRMAALTTFLLPYLPPQAFASEKIFASEFFIPFQSMTHPLN